MCYCCFGFSYSNDDDDDRNSGNWLNWIAKLAAAGSSSDAQ